MDYKRIIVIVPFESVGPIEERLHGMHVSGVTISRVRGHGEHRNVFSNDWMGDQAKIELFVSAAQSDQVLEALQELSRDAPPGAGIAAVVPVERFVHLRTGTNVSGSDSKS